MSTEQIAVRLPEPLLAVLDDLVARGQYESRAAAVRAGIELVVERDRRRLVDEAITEAYRRVPPTQGDLQAAIESMRSAIAEEPW
jgi:Arc/MetJ-type ribon-helix-helix transcriptional regulator